MQGLGTLQWQARRFKHWSDEKELLPGGVDVPGEGPRQRDHVGDAVVFDVGEADLVVHLVRRDPAHRLQVRVQLRHHGQPLAEDVL